MRPRNHQNHHQPLLLLACAAAFVYLLVRQFQGDHMLTIVQGNTSYMPDLSNIESISQSGVNPSPSEDSKDIITTTTTDTTIPTIKLNDLNALPLSFKQLGLSQTNNIQIDPRQIIVSSNTTEIIRSGEIRRFVGGETVNLGINVDEVIFYNDASWTNILVVMEITRNNQSLLLQLPFVIRRDNKKYLNQLIEQMTQ